MCEQRMGCGVWSYSPRQRHRAAAQQHLLTETPAGHFSLVSTRAERQKHHQTWPFSLSPSWLPSLCSVLRICPACSWQDEPGMGWRSCRIKPRRWGGGGGISSCLRGPKRLSRWQCHSPCSHSLFSPSFPHQQTNPSQVVLPSMFYRVFAAGG